MKKLFILLLLLPLIAGGQIISTVAGNGTAGYTGDGSVATVATINHPIEIAMDAAGNIYFAEQTNHCIRKVSTTGIISTVAGTGVAGYNGDGIAATTAKLNKPGGIAVDGAGNLYIADAFNSRIRKVDPSGMISTIAGTGTGGYGGDGTAATSALIFYPAFIRLSKTGDIYFSDNQNQRVRMINSSGIITTIAGNGSIGYTGDGSAATLASLSYPGGVWFDNTGNLFIADPGNNVVRKVSTTGTISTIAGNGTAGYGGDGAAATAAVLNLVEDVITDALGNVYIADNLNNRVRMINTSGIISTIAGNGTGGYTGDGIPATAAELNHVNGLCFNVAGDLFVADELGQRIRKISGPGDHAPLFTGGHSQSYNACINSINAVDALLPVADADVAQTLNWSLVSIPSHGTVSASYSTASTGGTVTPTGLTYTPVMGYTGSDLFSVRITDGIASDTTTINIVVNPLPDAGVISGTDSVCPGQSVQLSESVSGGIWSYSDVTVTSITRRGMVTGNAPGSDTVIYTVINMCGIESAIFPFYVRSYLACHTGSDIVSGGQDRNIYPNPSNGLFVIQIPGTGSQANITVTDMLGKVVATTITLDNKTVMNLGNTPAGNYIVKVSTGENTYREKIQIVR